MCQKAPPDLNCAPKQSRNVEVQETIGSIVYKEARMIELAQTSSMKRLSAEAHRTWNDHNRVLREVCAKGALCMIVFQLVDFDHMHACRMGQARLLRTACRSPCSDLGAVGQLRITVTKSQRG